MGVCTSPLIPWDLGAPTLWTPTWTGLTVGNGSLIYNNYWVRGKTVVGHLMFEYGSTTAISASVSLTLPVAAAVGTPVNMPVGIMEMFDVSATSRIRGQCRIRSGLTGIDLRVWNASGTYATANALSSTVPFAPGSGDSISLQFTYEGV